MNASTNTAVPIGRISLGDVRLSFPALFEPEAFKPGDPKKYKATFLVPKDSTLAKQIEAVILATAKAKWGAKAEAVIKGIRGNPNKFCWQDGDTKAYDGYEDMMALSCKATVRPLVIHQDKSPVTAEDGVIYAGCKVNASVEFFTYDNSGNGISCTVRGVQFHKPGDSFSAGRPADSAEFEAVTEGADSDDFA